MPKELKGRRALRSRSWSEEERGHTEHAQDGDQIKIYLERRPPEDLHVRGQCLLTVISTQAWDDVRARFLVKCM